MIKRIETLIEKLNYATLEYDAGNPIMSDEEWDNMYFELVSLEIESGIYLSNSPTQRIHYAVVNQLEKIEHNHKMLSLEKTKEIDTINTFVGNQLYLAMCKMDGLTCSIRYVDGKLVSAETRGNGLIGENILHNAMVIPSIPKRIKYKKELVLDGEIICTYLDFEKFSEEYKNPRNFAAGSIRLLDAKECQKRNLKFVVWDVIKGFEHVDNCNLPYLMSLIDHLGFITVPRIVGRGEVTEDLIESIKILAKEYSYPIDGAVFKFADIEYGKSLGETSHHFKNAMAFKFYDEMYSTVLKNIEWTMGRTGVLTPIAVFQPIDVDGSTVERASMHNISVMRELLGDNAHVGQRVEVFKANMIIPQIGTADKESHGKEVFEIPTTCPICGSPTVQRTDIDSTVLFCSNDMCEGKLINKLDHFCGKTGLDIKGLSTATLEKLMDWGWVNSFVDIYNLRDHGKEWMSKPGFGLKSVSNVLNAIEASKNCTLQAFICALGIPLIGSSASKDLCKYFSTWGEFRDAVSSNFKFYTLNGFGYEMDRAICNFDYTIADILAKEYLNIQEVARPEKSTTGSNGSKSLDGVTVVITGKLTQFKNRSELQSEIENRGGKVTGSVSKNTNYLINNDNTSSSAKNLSAQKLGIPVLTELEFMEQFLTN